MENKLQKLFDECIEELESIGINVIDNSLVGKVDINLAKRNTKRYGVCKQEEPDKNCYHIERKGNRNILKYDKFLKHHIEISKWVMQLDDSIIKNTIIHEIIHCFPNCNNHGATFKKYASYINQNLGYNISRVGNKKEDFEKSNMQFIEEKPLYKYKLVCEKCGQEFYRNRLQKNFVKKYRCGICGGKFKSSILYN